jgi:serine protease Do
MRYRFPLANISSILILTIAVTAYGQEKAMLSDLSRSFQTLSERVNKSVVRVVATGYRTLEPEESEEPGVAAKEQSTGSGTIIDEAGLIVTNAHVVIGAQRVRVTLAVERHNGTDGHGGRITTAKTVKAEVLGLDLETDVALLRIQEAGLPALRFGDSDKLEQGEIVLAFGSPLGLDNSVSMGIVSSTSRQLKLDDPMAYVQTDAPINPGSSGGPLVDSDGNVVGINTLILSQSGGSEGLGFAVPSNVVATVIAELKNKGRVVRGEIGVSVQTIRPTLAQGWGLPQDWGVVVSDVQPEGPGEQAGLKPGDVIQSLNGKVMESARQFNMAIYRPSGGTPVELVVLRGKKKLTIPVRVKERSNEVEIVTALASREQNLIQELGIFVVDIGPKLREELSSVRTEKGVYVAARSSEGPLFEEYFKAGDVIASINRQAVESVAGLRAALKKMKSGDAVAVQLERGGRLRFLSFELP